MASGPLPTQATPSGWSPTAISHRALRPFRSTTVTVPLSALATSIWLPSDETSIRLLDDPATAGDAEARRTASENERRMRKDPASRAGQFIGANRGRAGQGRPIMARFPAGGPAP